MGLQKLTDIIFGEYLPDLPAHQNPGLITALNVVPVTDRSYGPIGASSNYALAAAGTVLGSYAAVDVDATVHLIVGSASKLERYTVASTTPTDVSIAAGYTTGSEYWYGTQFGRRILMTNFNDPIQVFLLGTSTLFGNLASAAPNARDIAVVRGGWVMVINTNDTTNGQQPQWVWWCARNDATSWPVLGSAAAASALSGQVELRGPGGWNQRILAGLGPVDVLVIQERAVWRGTYVGLPDMFAFERVQGVVGTPVPGSVIQVGNVAAWLSEHGFILFNGVESFNIGAGKVDNTVWGEISITYLASMSGDWDPLNKRFVWSYSTSTATPDRVITYTPHLQRWTHANINLQRIGRGLGFGYTLENLDTINTSIDALAFSLDSRVWSNNRGNLTVFDTSNRPATLIGANLAATLTTGEQDVGRGKRVYIQGFRPIIDGGTITTAVTYRDTPQASTTTSGTSSAGTAGLTRHAINARFARVQTVIAASGTWTHAKGIEVYGKPGAFR